MTASSDKDKATITEEPFQIEVSCPDDNTNTGTPTDEEALETEEASSPPRTKLTNSEVWNLFGCVMAWACTIANVTLVVGTSNVVLLSIGGNPSLSTVPLATFFVGASIVSWVVTPWHFTKFGRTIGFLVGVALGLLGSTCGCLAVLYQVTPLLIVATTLFGAAMGIGFYMRFAAVEVVPKSWADKAVTLVVSGGCIAAFAGPESAQGTRGMFGEEYEYLGVFVMTGVFNIVNGIFTGLVTFPTPKSPNSNNGKEEPPSNDHNARTWNKVWPILQSRHFVIPVLVATGSWISMALPMSVLRVAMHQVGFTSRQSLLTIELHFLGMYAPGFVTGQWIAHHGPRLVSLAASSIFLVAFACLQLAKPAEGKEDIALWIVGMILIGIAWNCGFSASTVGSTRSYGRHPELKSVIQAANDGLTFLLAGAVISCASFIYQSGGQGLEGWRIVNWVVLGVIGLSVCILMLDTVLDRADGETPSNEKWSTPSIPAKPAEDS